MYVCMYVCKTSTGKIWYQSACQTRRKPVPVFWYRFASPISCMCVIGIKCVWRQELLFSLRNAWFSKKNAKKLHNFNQRADNQLPIRAGQDRMLAGQCVGNIMLQRNRTSLCFILKMCCPVRRASHYDTQVALLSQRGRALFRVCQ